MTYSITTIDRAFTTGGHVAAISDMNSNHMIDNFMLFDAAVYDCLDATCNIPAGSTLQFVDRGCAISGVTSICRRP